MCPPPRPHSPFSSSWSTDSEEVRVCVTPPLTLAPSSSSCTVHYEEGRTCVIYPPPLVPYCERSSCGAENRPHNPNRPGGGPDEEEPFKEQLPTRKRRRRR